MPEAPTPPDSDDEEEETDRKVEHVPGDEINADEGMCNGDESFD